MRSLTKISATPFFCAFLITACVGAQTKSQKQKLPAYDDRDGYEVLSVILNRLSVVRKNETIRISPATSAGLVVADIKAQCSGIPEEFHGASEDFDNKTKTKQILRRRFSLTKNYDLAYARLGVDLNQPETREEARRRIRSGTYYVAAVGFDDKRTHAIAFVEYICGNLCGDSIFYFLRKSEKGWEEAPEVQREVRACGRIY
jgi:hypothetical protein